LCYLPRAKFLSGSLVESDVARIFRYRLDALRRHFGGARR
jgi:hypothetical protein